MAADTRYGERMLTRHEIQILLGLLAEKTVVEPSAAFPYRVSAKATGYSDDRRVASLQSKLSIMLQLAPGD